MFRQWSEMFRQQKTPKPQIQTRHLHYYTGYPLVLYKFSFPYTVHCILTIGGILGTLWIFSQEDIGQVYVFTYYNMLRNYLFILNEPPDQAIAYSIYLYVNIKQIKIPKNLAFWTDTINVMLIRYSNIYILELYTVTIKQPKILIYWIFIPLKFRVYICIDQL